MDRPSFKTIVSTLTHLSCNPDITEMDYELFKSLQLSWKFEIQRCFQEHKKNESVSSTQFSLNICNKKMNPRALKTNRRIC